MHQLNIKVEVFKEDDLYVALCPSLNVSSFGESIDEAKKSLVEAVLNGVRPRFPILKENLENENSVAMWWKRNQDSWCCR